jgi:hypothetical protein
MVQPIKRDLKVSLKELESIKENIIYCGGTGTFYRKRTPDKPLSFNYANRQATICVKKENGKKYFTAWRMAVFFSHGYYPSFEDAVVFKDGDNYNFRINNIVVCHPNEDEQTVLDFATEHGLSPQTVNYRMRNAIRFERIVKNWRVFFYDKKEFAKYCGDLIGRRLVVDDEGIEHIQIKRINLSESQRGNKTARKFLKTWIVDMPTRWEMTLCK